MSSNIQSLSTLKFNEGSLCIDSLNLDQFSRTYAGGYSFNFINALSGSRDFKNKNFSNFYLTKKTDLSKLVKFKSVNIKPSSIYTPLNFSRLPGERGTFLKFVSEIQRKFFKDTLNYNDYKFYGATGFSEFQTSSKNLFLVEFIDDFYCSVSYVKNNIKYFLVGSDNAEVDGEIDIFFAAENTLSEDGKKIEYVLTKHNNDQFLSFFTRKRDKKYAIKPAGTILVGQDISNTPVNEFFINSISAKISFNLSTTITDPLDTSFVEYTDTEFLINEDKSAFNLDSNYLFYKSGDLSNNSFNLLNLKNISDNFDTFTSSNSLISSEDDAVFARKIRNYTSILNDIPSERDSNLELNYVTYNINYKFTPGTNIFTAPSSLNPFTKLNINDTKFTECGSFAYPYPYFSDRVYKKVKNVPNTEEQYLCTWLSGAPGEKGLWVDRYYYPDYTTKEDALNGIAVYQVTYLEAIEKLINDNTSLKTDVKKEFFFDKKSDLTFEPKEEYKYERISIDKIKEEVEVRFCDLPKAERDTPNYYKDINNNGGYAIAFKFYDKDFKVSSHFNEIEAGLNIEKEGNQLKIKITFFDNATETFDFFNTTHTLTDTNDNDLVLSFNNQIGRGNIYLNSIKIFTFRTNSFKYSNKQILFGNIKVESSEFKGDILRASLSNLDTLTNIFLSLSPLSEEDELLTVFSRAITKIDDLVVSLPCGMKNYTDNIEVLNTLANNLKSKSNVVDININNLNIDNLEILEGVKNNLLTVIEKDLPATTVINKLNFKNYL
jgi:hypothetical protein|tara:strand:- start:1915 stop:4233 length:2319 start_codon:yes stop_codon:yes gene_type:complete